MKKRLSVMVADDNEGYAKGLGEFIGGRDDMEFAGYALDGEEALELAMLVRPDVIVLDMLMPRLDGMGFMRRLGSIGAQREKPVIIINSMSKLRSMIETAERAGADYFMLKPQSFECVCDTIADICMDRTEEKAETEAADGRMIELGVSNYLRTLGVPVNLDGYKYIRSAIMMAADDMSLLEPITKKLYPMIADKFHTNGGCVERSMRHAIKVSWQRGNKKMINDIFGYSSEDGKRRPTNSEYIAMAADDFRLRCKYGMLDAV